MSVTWFTSDLHFRHNKVAELRGFTHPGDGTKAWPDSLAHDEEVIKRWNARVRPIDHVWVLGDVAMGSMTETFQLVDRLHGVKHLVTGNHDAPWPGHRDSRKIQKRWLEHFESVQAFAKIRLAGEEVLLSHFPYDGDHTDNDRATQFRLRDEGKWLLHGHLHVNSRVTGPRSIHVGLDAWGLAPARDSEVVCEMHGIFSAELEEMMP
jgi:calcineurin-like phosphoesterase family protein